jgi:hypothetical protein
VASTFWRQVVDIGLLLSVYGLIDWWIRRHHQDMDDPQDRARIQARYAQEIED